MAHKTDCQSVEPGIIRETCRCGMVRFIPTSGFVQVRGARGSTPEIAIERTKRRMEIASRLKELNKTDGNPGDPDCARAIRTASPIAVLVAAAVDRGMVPEATVIQQAEQVIESHSKAGAVSPRRDAPSTRSVVGTAERGSNAKAALPPPQLKPKEEEKTAMTDQTKGLPPVPARPDVAGKNMWQRNQASAKWYGDNRAAIRLYVDRLGEGKACQEWGISYATWSLLKHDILPEKYGPRVNKRTTQRKAPPATKPAVNETKTHSSATKQPRTVTDPCAAAPDLPRLPDWDAAWPGEMKLEWMRCFHDIAGGG